MEALLVMTFDQKPEPRLFAINSDAEDLIWVRDIKENGSEKAFTGLMKKYQKRIYWLIRRSVYDHHEADEITQQVFLQVYHKIHQFREDSKFYTWLYRITTNQMLQYFRKNKSNKHINIEHVVETEGDENSQTDTQVLSEEISNAIQVALNYLPPQQKLVFQYRYYEELSYEEISKIMGRSVGALKANYFHAINKLKEKLKDAGIEM